MAAADELSIDIISSFLAKLDVVERCRCGATCRRWRRAAAQPPFSEELVIAVAGDVPDGDVRSGLAEGQSELTAQLTKRNAQLRFLGMTEEAEANERLLAAVGAAGRRALSVAHAAAAMRSAACAGVRRVTLTVLLARPGSWQSGGLPALRGLAESLPEGTEELEVNCPGAVPLSTYSPKAIVAGLALREAAPASAPSRSASPPAPWAQPTRPAARRRASPPLSSRARARQVPPAATERAGFVLQCDGPAALAALPAACPALRAVHRLDLSLPAGPPQGLAALAATGLRCRQLSVRAGPFGEGPRAELRGAAAAAALAALLSDPAPDFGAPAPALRALVLEKCALPEAREWPPGALRGLQRLEVRDCALDAAQVSWLFGGDHAPTLQQLELQVSLDGVPPRALAAAAEALPEGTAVKLYVSMTWSEEESGALLEAIAASPRLAGAVDVPFAPAGKRARASYDRYWGRPPSKSPRRRRGPARQARVEGEQ
eukprot:tig00021318_g20157.t1